jgi:hypothetical protein
MNDKKLENNILIFIFLIIIGTVFMCTTDIITDTPTDNKDLNIDPLVINPDNAMSGEVNNVDRWGYLNE